MFGAIGQFALGQATEAEEDTQAGALLDMLSAEELAHMRTGTGLLMPDTCNLLTLTTTPDGMGGYSEAWGTAAGTISCRLDITNKMDGMGGASMREYQATILSVPYNTTIDVNYRVEHGGFTYNVTAVNNDQSWIAVKRVSLERV